MLGAPQPSDEAREVRGRRQLVGVKFDAVETATLEEPRQLVRPKHRAAFAMKTPRQAGKTLARPQQMLQRRVPPPVGTKIDLMQGPAAPPRGPAEPTPPGMRIRPM